MNSAVTTAIVVGSFSAYAFIGVVVGVLLERSEDANALSVVAGMLWPLVIPAMCATFVVRRMYRVASSVGDRIHDWARDRRSSLPKATAKQKETK